MNFIWISLALALSIFNCPFAHADDGAAGFEWASAREVYDKAECYTESGGFLRNSEAFTNGCLDFLGEKPSDAGDDSPKEEVTEEAPSMIEEEAETVSNKDFIPDSWEKS